MIDAVSSSVLQVLIDVGRYLTESNDLFTECVVEAETKKESWKEIPKKKKNQNCTWNDSQQSLGNRQKNMMKHLYRGRISLREMEKDYIVPTKNEANKETLCLYICSNVVAHKIEINTTSSISKLQTENIKN